MQSETLANALPGSRRRPRPMLRLPGREEADSHQSTLLQSWISCCTRARLSSAHARTGAERDTRRKCRKRSSAVYAAIARWIIPRRKNPDIASQGAPCRTLINTESDEPEGLDNQTENHEHGAPEDFRSEARLIATDLLQEHFRVHRNRRGSGCAFQTDLSSSSGVIGYLLFHEFR